MFACLHVSVGTLCLYVYLFLVCLSCLFIHKVMFSKYPKYSRRVANTSDSSWQYVCMSARRKVFMSVCLFLLCLFIHKVMFSKRPEDFRRVTNNSQLHACMSVGDSLCLSDFLSLCMSFFFMSVSGNSFLRMFQTWGQYFHSQIDCLPFCMSVNHSIKSLSNRQRQTANFLAAFFFPNLFQ